MRGWKASNCKYVRNWVRFANDKGFGEHCNDLKIHCVKIQLPVVQNPASVLTSASPAKAFSLFRRQCRHAIDRLSLRRQGVASLTFARKDTLDQIRPLLSH
jgi:hypothetical protein